MALHKRRSVDGVNTHTVDAMHWLPTVTDVAQFFDGFWPNFAATALGLALGVPVGLAVDRFRQRQTQGIEAERDQARLVETVAQVVQWMEANDKVLAEIVIALHPPDTTSVVVEAAIQIAPWEVVRPDFLRLVNSPDVKVDVAAWFERLQRVKALCAQHAELGLGVASSLSAAPANREAVRRVLVAVAATLRSEHAQLAERVRSLVIPS